MEQSSSWKRVFAVFWTAQAFSLFGSSLVQFALVWWLAERTGSATVLAFASLAATVPGIIVGPFVGVLVDRWSRRVLLVAADAASAVVAIAFVGLFWSGQIETWHLYVGMAVRSLAQSIQLPAEHASTALMVPEAQLARVAGLNQLLQGLMMIAAPPLGALLIGIMPLEYIILLDVVTGALAIVLVLCIRIPRPARQHHEAQPASFAREFVGGLRYVLGWAGLLQLIVMAAAVNLFISPTFILLPLLVTRSFGGGALELAWLNVAFGTGYLAGGIALSLWGGFRRRIVTSTAGLMTLGVGTMVVGATPTYWFTIALVGMVIVGISIPVANGPIMAILQSVVAQDMQGRVFTVMSSLVSIMAPIGLLATGPAADSVSVNTLYLISGAACLLIGAVATTSKVLLAIEDHHTAVAPVVPAFESST